MKIWPWIQSWESFLTLECSGVSVSVIRHDQIGCVQCSQYALGSLSVVHVHSAL